MRSPILTKRAKSMRKTPSEREQRPWLALRAKRFDDVKFRRQKVVGPYMVDFAARNPMLVVELDGDTHVGREGYDVARSRFLEDQGYSVIRFINADVMGNLEGVLTALRQALRTPPLPTLSPERERAL